MIWPLSAFLILSSVSLPLSPSSPTTLAFFLLLLNANLIPVLKPLLDLAGICGNMLTEIFFFFFLKQRFWTRVTPHHLNLSLNFIFSKIPFQSLLSNPSPQPCLSHYLFKYMNVYSKRETGSEV